jgi:DNA-binding NtrC family response regulator
MKPRLLFVDDEERIVRVLEALFRSEFDVVTTTHPIEALELTKTNNFQVIVSDQRMPDMLGVDLLSRVKMLSPNSVRILLTGYSDLTAIVGSINEGEIFRFVNKPWDTSAFRQIVREAAEISRDSESASLSQSLSSSMPLAPADKETLQGEILVLDDQNSTFREIGELAMDSFAVHFARNLDSAIQIFSQKPISIVIADISLAGQSTMSFLKAVKEIFPQVMTIALTEISDARQSIRMINQARVFRVAFKPINSKLLRRHIDSAYQNFVQYSVGRGVRGLQAVEAPRGGSFISSTRATLYSASELKGLWSKVRDVSLEE